MTPISFYHPDSNKIFAEQSWYPSTRYHQYAQHTRRPNASAFAQTLTGGATSFRGNMKYQANLAQIARSASDPNTSMNNRNINSNCNSNSSNHKMEKQNTSHMSRFTFPTLERRGTVEVE